MRDLVFTAFFAFGGLGGAARGFLDARVELSSLGVGARFEVVGGFDVDPEACRDFHYLTGVAQHEGDVETMTVAELRACCPRRPDVVVITAPCVGASGLLAKGKAAEPHYQNLNELALRFVRLMLVAWSDDLPLLVLFENVPNIRNRAPKVVAELKRLLRAAGYLLHERLHNCGELSEEAAQNRRRWLLVGRHPGRVPALLRLPPRHLVKGVHTVIGELPRPGDASAGPMHREVQVEPITAVRLALIEAAKDWKALPPAVWLPQELRAAVAGCAPSERTPFNDIYRVVRWSDPAAAVTAGTGPSAGAMSVADPRLPGEGYHDCVYGIVPWDGAAHTVTDKAAAGTGPFSVADPRATEHWYGDVLGVRSWEGPVGTVTGRAGPTTGGFSVADPRLTCTPRDRSGAYGVVPWKAPVGTVVGAACHDNGRWSVADPRTETSPRIVALDGTWHRPFTTLELGMLQGLPSRLHGAPLKLAGRADGRHRKRIGNMVPVWAGRALAREMLLTLTNGALGRFDLSSDPVWVAPQEDLPEGAQVLQ